ncbi:replication initiation negative regulator SeqA [Paraferrimonas sedimenticola]|uniref:Negative modulator of initiation of replication n=1 Tax=Paraferrimonas sedimenticola TaxID=375674 RepID=A0AA37VVX9_9GAMM|nr:replication initiation negative regulator SeqA [Paraferrimonas sedimenticola]GLP96251.1 negative modulator of initiation of replication [Paraferrimonas sedimenticola]
MKYIEVDEQLYRYIASCTKTIGESASDILRRELGLPELTPEVAEQPETISQPSLDSDIAVEAHPEVEVAAEEVVEETTEATIEEVAPTNSQSFKLLLDDSNLEHMKGAVGRFIYLLQQAHQNSPSAFEKVLQVQGRGRLYFATSKEELLKASATANPKQIGESQYWVTSNNNTARKRAILTDALTQLGCDSTLAQDIAKQI